MKLAVAGKGGVGKTLISGTLSRLLGRDGYRVLAIDADPAMNLSYALGISTNRMEEIIPLMENSELIGEKTKVGSDTNQGGLFRLNPTVDDLVDRIGIKGLIIKNGYTKAPEIWEKNSRVKTVIVSINNKEKYKLHLMDVIGFQWVFFALTEFKAQESIEIKIEDVYKGTMYSDTAITELYPLIGF